jgi:hypothetical protein
MNMKRQQTCEFMNMKVNFITVLHSRVKIKL